MRTTIRQFARKIPGARFAYRRLVAFADRWRTRRETERVFTSIFQNNEWLSEESVSGPGSTIRETRLIAAELPTLLRQLKVATFLDVPCGDFNWMRTVDLGQTRYVGGDIVKELVERNKRYESSSIRFEHLDLLNDRLPSADLILCRDCFIHFPLADIFRALRNHCRSRSTYLLTTTFPDTIANADIKMGDCRPLNLERAPFYLPPPLRLIHEDPTGRKSLGLWRLADIAERLARAGQQGSDRVAA